MKNYHLITTADERSWVFDRPVLFLGEWCRRYDRKHIWSNMDALVAHPYGITAVQKTHDLNYLNLLFDQLIIELTQVLNAFHQTQYSARYWTIVIGHWLRRYLLVSYNRYQTVKQAFINYPISGTTVFNREHYSLATVDSSEFVWACNNDQWNHVLYSMILEERGCERFPVNSDLNEIQRYSRVKRPIIKNKLRFHEQLRSLVLKYSASWGRSTDAFIINTYLPFKEVLKLQLCLKQIPQFWQSPEYLKIAIDNQRRQEVMLNIEVDEGVERFIRRHLIEAIPSCYFENYQNLEKVVKNINWPEKPKFIFTSNNFDTDEVFKVWTGLKVETGTPYYVGQHGNNYGTLMGFHKWPELMTSDKFFTWGWSYETKHVPAFIFKSIRQKKEQFDSNGGILLIELHKPHWLGPGDDYYEFGLYQAEQLQFSDQLSTEIRRALTVRLHHHVNDMNWFEDRRWKDHHPEIKLDFGTKQLKQLIAESRLIVHSYDSTGILETLSLNIPTLCFWRDEFEHIIPEAKPYYARLKEVGIFHETPEQAAVFINKHWNMMDVWWNSLKVQEARNYFCSQYAKVENKPCRTLVSLLTRGNERDL